jgi:thiamine-phosphate pyrophosphorylase
MPCNIDHFLIYLIADAALVRLRPLTELVELAVEGGVSAVQYRDKQATQQERIDCASRLQVVVGRYHVPLIVNDDMDVALAVGAAGVHVGQDDMQADVVRSIAGDEFIVGVSAHNVDEARRAREAGADYVGFGPVFPTETKMDTAPVTGIDGLRAFVAQVDIPVIAIGGITSDTAAAVIDAGADGVAVAATILNDDDPRVAAMRLRDSICGKGVRRA